MRTIHGHGVDLETFGGYEEHKMFWMICPLPLSLASFWILLDRILDHYFLAYRPRMIPNSP
jgi:hypothetical protein